MSHPYEVHVCFGRFIKCLERGTGEDLNSKSWIQAISQLYGKTATQYSDGSITTMPLKSSLEKYNLISESGKSEYGIFWIASRLPFPSSQVIKALPG